MKTHIVSKVKELEPAMIAWRRDVHKHAEPAWLEFRTAALAITKLKALGYTITMGDAAVTRSCMMGVPLPEHLQKEQQRAIDQGADPLLVKAMDGGLTAFVAEMRFSDEGSCLGIRTDMDSNDANEACDDKHRPYKEGFSSVNAGVMHACGHDAHVAIALATAELVAGMKDALKGSIRFIFQPAEEGGRGAAPMVAAGVTKNLDYILGFHVGFQASEAGCLICGAKGFLASTKWNVTFTGDGAHAGAAPQEGKNALLAAAVASLNLHAISRHGDGATRINVGKLVAGEGRNVVPPSALLIMETRGVTTALNTYMMEQAARVIKAAAEMYNCEYSIELTGNTESGESSPEMIEIIYDIAKDMPQYTDIVKLKDFGASEDYSHMMTEVQKAGGIGSYMQVGVDMAAGHHNSRFDIDETGLAPALELVSRIVYKILAK